MDEKHKGKEVTKQQMGLGRTGVWIWVLKALSWVECMSIYGQVGSLSPTFWGVPKSMNAQLFYDPKSSRRLAGASRFPYNEAGPWTSRFKKAPKYPIPCFPMAPMGDVVLAPHLFQPL